MTADSSKSTATGTIDQLQDWLRDRILDRVGSAIESRKAYWAEEGRERPAPADVRRIRQVAAAKNAATAAGMTLVPGPAGVLTVPPELLLSLATTVGMVYDIAVAFDMEDRVDTEMVVATALSDTNKGVLGFVFDEGDPTKARKPASRIAGKMASVLARNLLIRLLRMAFGRLVPVVGSAGAGMWARTHTLGVGRRAEELFQRQMEAATDAANETLEEELDSSLASPDEPQESEALRRLRHAVYGTALRRMDDPSDAQRKRFDALVHEWDLGLSDAGKTLSAKDDPSINLPLLGTSIDADDLFAELGALGQLGEPVSAEYARELGQVYGLGEAEVDELLGAED